MNTQGKVNKRLFSKTELDNQKVELSLIDDAKQILGDLKFAEQLFSDIESVSKDAVKEYANLAVRKEKVKDNFRAVIDMESFIRRLGKTSSRADNILREMNTQAKELGISPTTIKEYDKLFDFTVKISEGVNQSDKFITDIKGLNKGLK